MSRPSQQPLTSWALIFALAACKLACAQPPAAQAPPAPAATDASPELAATPAAAGEDLEACRERMMHEGIATTAGGAVRGSSYHRAADEKRVQGDGKGEREAYLELIQKEPQSPYVPFAYFAFGELFRDEAKADASKAPLAEQGYKEALKYPAPANRLFLLARFRLAQIYALEQQTSVARDAYQQLLDDASAHADWDCATPVAEAAQRALERLTKSDPE